MFFSVFNYFSDEPFLNGGFVNNSHMPGTLQRGANRVTPNLSDQVILLQLDINK